MKRLVLIIMMLAVACIVRAREVRIDTTEVADSAFACNTGISRLIVGAGVRSIGNFAFADCPFLEEVVFESDSELREIGRYAFAGCEKLRYIKLPDFIDVLDDGAFRWCHSLECIVFPASLKEIRPLVCSENTSLRRVIFGGALQRIGNSAFIGCDSLQTVDFPTSLKSIGLNAFCLCISLESVVIPDSVSELESYAFAGCHALKEVVLPANQSLLGELIFSDCPSLVRMTELSPVPPEFDCMSFPAEPDDKAFYERCELLVPSDEIGNFSKAHGWNLFRNITPFSGGNDRMHIQ